MFITGCAEGVIKNPTFKKRLLSPTHLGPRYSTYSRFVDHVYLHVIREGSFRDKIGDVRCDFAASWLAPMRNGLYQSLATMGFANLCKTFQVSLRRLAVEPR